MSNLTITAGEVALRLDNLGQYMPEADETLCAFARHLATRLDLEVTPIQFHIDWLLAVNHWPHGDYNRVKVSAGANLQKVVEAIFPADFAAEIRSLIKRTDAFLEEVGDGASLRK